MNAVHTSAQAEADMFGGTDAEPEMAANRVLEIQGELIHAAEVRTKVVGTDQHPVPVLCIDLRPLSGIKRTIHLEQVYTEATRKDAEAKACALKRGAHITFQTDLTGMRTMFPDVRSVTLNLQP